MSRSGAGLKDRDRRGIDRDWSRGRDRSRGGRRSARRIRAGQHAEQAERNKPCTANVGIRNDLWKDVMTGNLLVGTFPEPRRRSVLFATP